MEVIIHSLDSIIKLAEKPFEKPTALISMDDPGSDELTLKNKPKYILRLYFDDILPSEIEDEFGDSNSMGMQILSPEQAKEIAEFVYNCKDSVDTLICQCYHGMSRSAAVAAAVKEHFYHNGIDVFADEKYCPNTYVFRSVLAALKKNKIKQKQHGCFSISIRVSK